MNSKNYVSDCSKLGVNLEYTQKNSTLLQYYYKAKHLSQKKMKKKYHSD